MIPIGTDAPIYHRPIATGILIVANVLISLGLWADPDAWASWALACGDGLHPLQWLTASFLHPDIIRLAINMIFLWTFGLIVEGKVGPLVFAALYLALSAAACATVQALMLHVGPDLYAPGASGVTCGLIGVGLVWAPRNEINFLMIFFLGFMIRVFELEWAVASFAMLYFARQAFDGLFSLALFGPFVLVREGMNLVGVLLGLALGALMVKANWADCEGWDIFSRGASGRTKLPDKKAARAKRKGKRPADVEARSAEALADLRAAIDDGAALEALAAYHDLARMPTGWRPLEPDVLKLISVLQKGGDTIESIPVMGDYITRFPEKAARVRLKLAQVLLREQQRPHAALKVLAPLDELELPGDLHAIRERMEREARRLLDEGVLEVEGEPW